MNFFRNQNPVLTVMIKQTQNPENIISEVNRALAVDAEGFGIQLEGLPRCYHNYDNLKKYSHR